MTKLNKSERNRVGFGFVAIALVLAVAIGGSVMKSIDGESPLDLVLGWTRKGGEPVKRTQHLDPEGVRELKLSGLVGEIEITAADLDQLEIVESIEHDGGLGQKALSELEVSAGGTLEITGPDLQRVDSDGRHLTIRLPRNLAASLSNIVGNSSMGALELTGVEADTIDLAVEMGTAAFRDVRARTFKAGVEMGDCVFSGEVSGEFSADADMGKVDATFGGVLPRKVSAAVEMGSLELSIPADAGFTADLSDAIDMGEVDCDFPMTGGVVRHGDGSSVFDLSCDMGDLSLKRME